MRNSFNATKLRKTILKMAYAGSTVHIGCAFSLVELVAVLYRNHIRATDPTDPNRDYLALSKGHGVMAVYAALSELGWLNEDDITNYFKNGTRLKGLGDPHVPGVEVMGGSLGHGLSVAVGLAIAAKRKGTDQKTFCIVGDGEMNEGPMWEAMLLAAQHKLDNLCIIVDENKFQAMGTTEDIMSLGNLKTKFEAFGFDCHAIDGHDEAVIDASLSSLMNDKNGRPKAIVADTVKGKGVSFMEGDNIWHYTRLKDDTFKAAMTELGA